MSIYAAFFSVFRDLFAAFMSRQIFLNIPVNIPPFSCIQMDVSNFKWVYFVRTDSTQFLINFTEFQRIYKPNYAFFRYLMTTAFRFASTSDPSVSSPTKLRNWSGEDWQKKTTHLFEVPNGQLITSSCVRFHQDVRWHREAQTEGAGPTLEASCHLIYPTKTLHGCCSREEKMEKEQRNSPEKEVMDIELSKVANEIVKGIRKRSEIVESIVFLMFKSMENTCWGI